MSNVKVQGNALGTGTLTIAAPNTNSDRTLTLPDNSGTLLSNASTTGFPAGSVLQVVSATYGVITTISSGTYVDTGLSASITPSSASSKILVLVFQPARVYQNIGTAVGYANLVRGSTQLTETSFGFRDVGDGGVPVSGTQVSISWLDSPSTASSVTYKTQGKINSADAAQYNIDIYGNVVTSSIILMEIAA